MEKKGVMFLILACFMLSSSIVYFVFLNNPHTCGDGTSEGKCSVMKPYYCSSGTLKENVSGCGCSNVSRKRNGKCVTLNETSPKNISLKYILRGKEGNINFTIYQGLVTYIQKIPRDIASSENPTLVDFRLKPINEEQQREALLPLVVAIENLAGNKEDQARIAISIIQEIPFGKSNKTYKLGNEKVAYTRYPYEVLYENEGVCGEKSELLIFLLRELGYGTAFLYYIDENHEAVGIKCPVENAINGTEYCFVETTGPSIITDDKIEYIGTIARLISSPRVINISEGFSLERNIYEYKDARTLISIRKEIQRYGTVNYLQHFQYQSIKRKYGLASVNSSYSF